jgi:phospholipid transport system substrate-binding protein
MNQSAGNGKKGAKRVSIPVDRSPLPAAARGRCGTVLAALASKQKLSGRGSVYCPNRPKAARASVCLCLRVSGTVGFLSIDSKNPMKRHLFAFFTAAFVSAAAWAQTAPVDVVKQAVVGTIDAMKEDPAARSGDMAKITQIVQTHFLPATNFERTVRIAVGAPWQQATPAQQQELTKQFKVLMSRTYAASLAQLGTQDARFSFKPGQATANDALVLSTVTTPGDSQQVGYRLGKAGGEWKIYDIDMSGAWLIQVYQNQFKAQLSQGGIDGLIKYLTAHNAREE